MLVTMDKRGSISLPASIRRELGAKPGTHFELSMEPGGNICLHPVEIYRKIKLSESGLDKLREARDSESASLPDWFQKDIDNAGTETE